jgi:AAA family ATP:ADP antiporter
LIIVVAEYVSYALGELIFLETLKEMYPTPSEYCQYMGNLTLWTGVMTAFSALIVTPYLLQTYRWSHTALITPILMILTTLAFFGVVCFGKIGLFPGASPVLAAVVLGSLHFCIGRSIKYTLFDATKELAFIPLDQETQVKGKLIIDGIGSRLGRGTSSLLSIILVLLTGGLGESALFAGILATLFAVIAIPPFRFIGHEFEKLNTPATGVKAIPAMNPAE